MEIPEEPQSAAAAGDGPEAIDWRRHLKEARRLVGKLGTNVLTRENGELAMGRIHSLIEEGVDLARSGRQVIIVSSGAISLGVRRPAIPERPPLPAAKRAP